MCRSSLLYLEVARGVNLVAKRGQHPLHPAAEQGRLCDLQGAWRSSSSRSSLASCRHLLVAAGSGLAAVLAALGPPREATCSSRGCCSSIAPTLTSRTTTAPARSCSPAGTVASALGRFGSGDGEGHRPRWCHRAQLRQRPAVCALMWGPPFRPRPLSLPVHKQRNAKGWQVDMVRQLVAHAADVHLEDADGRSEEVPGRRVCPRVPVRMPSPAPFSLLPFSPFPGTSSPSCRAC